MKEAIATLHWKACETCKYEKIEGGCTIEDEITFDVDYSRQHVLCDDYEEA